MTGFHGYRRERPREHRERPAQPSRAPAEWAASDLAQLLKLWPAAQAALVPGQAAGWSERTLTDEERARASQEAAAERSERIRNARDGVSAPGEHPAPARLAIVVQLAEVEDLIVRLAADLWDRAQQTIARHDVERREPPRPPRPLVEHRHLWAAQQRGMSEADARWRRATSWLQTAIPGLTGQQAEEALETIKRALRIVRLAAGQAEQTHRIKAPCPVCGRLSLRANVDNHDRTRWFVQCHNPRCQCADPQECGCEEGRRHRWWWHAWGTLSEQLGVDVLAALEGAA